MTDRDIFNPRDGEDFEAGVPNVRRRKPERAGKPRVACEDDLALRMAQIVDDIIARDRMPDGKLRWR